jgi:hypothetical protein
MSHRSRVCAFVFDTSTSSCESTARFWSGALGRALTFDPNERYTSLPGELDYFIQSVEPADHGVHIDFETDNVEAEVNRLEGLGAAKKYPVKDWWVMEDPGGHAFCVVPVQSKTWPQGTTEWP